MRALRLCGLTLAVAAVHLAGWRIFAGTVPRSAASQAGIRWITVARTVPRAALLAAGSAPSDPPMATGAAGGARTPSHSPEPPRAPSPARRMRWRGHPPPVPPRPARERPPTPARPPGTLPRRPTAPDPASAISGGTAFAPAVRRQRAQAGRGGVLRPAAARAWPVYATRPPPSVALRYRLVQGGGGAAGTGTADLEWRLDGARYHLRVATAPAGRAPREWLSIGGFDAAGLAPLRLVEREKGRDKRAINFDHEARRVRFSASAQALALAPGAQDRWSWVAQLAAIAEAAAATRPATIAGPVPGTTWQLQVAGLRGELDRWVFRVLPDAELPPEARRSHDDASTPDDRQASRLLRVVREPERPYDFRIEAWLSPERHHWPVGLRMSTPPGSWSLALWPAGADDAPVHATEPRGDSPAADAPGGT